MNGMIIPSPDSIPVPWGYFKFLLLLTFPLHLLMMNAMLGSAVACVCKISLAAGVSIAWQMT